MKKSMVIWVILGILFIIYLGPKTLNILGENVSGQFQTVLRDQNGGFVFTPDSVLLNVECPFINDADPTSRDCGSANIIWVDDKVYSCANVDIINSLSTFCNVLSIYPKFKMLCDNPIRRSDNTFNPEQPVCRTAREEFGTISNPLSVGDHQWEYLGLYKTSNSQRFIHDIKTVTITSELKCGDNICSVERDETYLNCNQDCPPPDCKNGIKDGNEEEVDCGGQCANPCNVLIICTPDYIYNEWTSCKNNVQSRDYSDRNSCGKTPSEPLLRSCIVENPPGKPIVETTIPAIIYILGGLIIILLLWWFLKKKR